MAEPGVGESVPEPKAPGPPVRVVIDFEPGTEVAGVVAADGPATEFHGRLELYAAIERAREAPPRRPLG
jgi:hypothetical protein